MVYLTIISRAGVGYEMISNKRKWNNCILLDLADFAVQE